MSAQVRYRAAISDVFRTVILVPSAFFFFFNDTAPPEISSLPLPDALPISFAVLRPTPPSRVNSSIDFGTSPPCRSTSARQEAWMLFVLFRKNPVLLIASSNSAGLAFARSEEHTSELQSRSDLVCRLLLEKK